MSTQLYTQVEAYIDGAKLTEATSVNVDLDNQAQIVETLNRGFAGVSKGAARISISIANAVPAASFEYEPSAKILGLEPVELTLYAAGKSLSSKGFLMKFSMSGAVNSPSGISLEFVGEPASWE